MLFRCLYPAVSMRYPGCSAYWYLDERLAGVLVFGCVAIAVMADPVRLGVSTPALLYKV